MKEVFKRIVLYPSVKERQKRSIQRMQKDYNYYQKYTKEEINYLLIETETKLNRKKYTFPISYISILSVTFVAFYYLNQLFGRAIRNFEHITDYFKTITREEYGQLIFNMYIPCFLLLLLVVVTSSTLLISNYSTTQKEVSLLKLVRERKNKN
ncbi:hypothetical protein EA94_01164 [Enterococcus faecalis]|uniref:hypothetical protein n=1 Tax=Enterococcus faecalis TaxID=1351 RepID=UPI000DE81608|nr:hypothetical protein [Enterococcus faecalis]RBS17130.1 hypothetical protein EA94_01164 [Enterococcus faecalis]